MEFVCTIDLNKFRSTNALWNELMLNDPWSVGYVTTLIELQPFLKKEDWELFYYNSGEERHLQISKLDIAIQSVLQNESLIRTNRSEVDKMDYKLRNLNTQFGRTKDDFCNKGKILYDKVKDNGLRLTVEECIECVRYRVICETWNGIIVREKRTIATLQQFFPNSEFKKVLGEVDYKYAVDYEIYKNGKLFVAIQIKPKSYTWNAPYILRARYANQQKNKEYTGLFKVPVFDIISDNKGSILNTDVLKNL
jgi:ferredoxin-like protein FixX